MSSFEAWLKCVTPEGATPIFVAFNAPFDWMFISDYFYRYLGRNPFGHSAVDIKAYYMGMSHVPWDETTMKQLAPRYLGSREATHHALRDAIDQAEMFRKMLADVHGNEKRNPGPSKGTK
jgi:ribonuclease T